MKKIFRTGNPSIWLTAGTLTVCLLMISGLIVLIMVNGFGIFWPRKIVQFTLRDGTVTLGEIAKKESIPHQKKRLPDKTESWQQGRLWVGLQMDRQCGCHISGLSGNCFSL